MATIETAISVQDWLHQEIVMLANEMQVSQSELFAIAMQEFLECRRQQKFLDSWNEAYADGLDPSEKMMLASMRRHQKQLMEQED